MSGDRHSRIRGTLEGIYYSLPVQFIVFQFRYNKGILFFWLLLFLFVSNSFGTGFGLPYLFLEPEYMGETSFWSMSIIGAALGTFIVSYQIAMYILESYRFQFLALETHPFHIFYLNNAVIPGAFLLFYTQRFLSFQHYIQGGFTWEIFWELSGLYFGLVLMLFVIAFYFRLTNQNIFKLFGKAIAQELRRPRMIIDKAKSSMAVRNRVDWYFSGVLKLEPVDKNAAVDFRSLVRILNQNHGNALLLELILMISLISLGFLEDNPLFQIPSGASILLAFSLMLMLLSAISFWFRKMGPLTLLIIVTGFSLVSMSGFLESRHPALGMNYAVPPAEYSPASVVGHASDQNIFSDYLNTVTILNKWKDDYQAFHGKDKKPRVVLVCTSGGGLRSSYFTIRAMQVLDSMTNGRFMDQTRLICGASGGMVGASYYREIYMQSKLGHEEDIWQPSKAEGTSRDLLNRIFFKVVSGLFLPNLTDKVGSRRYASDRGFSLDEQMQDNLPWFRDRRLSDYRQAETEALIPMLVLSPVIVNDGRKLFISATPVTYLTRTINPKEGIDVNVSGIEFSRFFRNQDPDSLLWVNALRMNASFPLITPFITLPSDPPLQLIDAGVADNFGITVAMRFLYVFREWLASNTSGVLILQIRDTERELVAQHYHEKGMVGKFFDPLGAFYHSYSLSRDFANEESLNYTGGMYRGKVDFASIQYVPEDSSGTRASLSWHLTSREKQYIENGVRQQRNQAEFRKVAEWLSE